MPSGGVVRVALPVACKRKELWIKLKPPSYIHTGVTVYTAHTSLGPLIHSTATFGRYLFTVERVRFIESAA